MGELMRPSSRRRPNWLRRGHRASESRSRGRRRAERRGVRRPCVVSKRFGIASCGTKCESARATRLSDGSPISSIVRSNSAYVREVGERRSRNPASAPRRVDAAQRSHVMSSSSPQRQRAVPAQRCTVFRAASSRSARRAIASADVRRRHRVDRRAGDARHHRRESVAIQLQRAMHRVELRHVAAHVVADDGARPKNRPVVGVRPARAPPPRTSTARTRSPSRRRASSRLRR